MRALGLSHGMDFDSKRNTRDVAWLGDCDEGCEALANLLGWAVSNAITLLLGA
jgi:NAD-dependent deacetylase sirtuin 2